MADPLLLKARISENDLVTKPVSYPVSLVLAPGEYYPSLVDPEWFTRWSSWVLHLGPSLLVSWSLILAQARPWPVGFDVQTHFFLLICSAPMRSIWLKKDVSLSFSLCPSLSVLFFFFLNSPPLWKTPGLSPCGALAGQGGMDSHSSSCLCAVLQ